MKTINSIIVKVFVVSLLFTLLCFKAQGQDVIIKKSGEEIKGQVTEILDMEIKYKKFDNLTGPVYSIKKSEVVLIIYANGKKEVINSENSPVVSQSQQTINVNSVVNGGNIGRARAGSILNYALIAPILGLGVAAIAVDQEDPSSVLGYAAIGIGTIFIPIASVIAGNPMRSSGVKGSPALRIVGWISYGLFVADAVSLIALQDEIDDVASTAIPIVVFGTLSTTFMGLDKSIKAMQGKSKMGIVSLQPTVGYVRNISGNKYPTVGVRINF